MHILNKHNIDLPVTVWYNNIISDIRSTLKKERYSCHNVKGQNGYNL